MKVRSSSKIWVLIVALVIIVAAGGYLLYKNNSASADIMSSTSTGKEISKTVLGATVSQDYSAKDVYITAKVTEGNPIDIGKTIFISNKKSATTFVTPPSGSSSFYSYGSFCGSFNVCATFKKGDKILVSGDRIAGYLKNTWVVADAITLTTKRNITRDISSNKAAGFKSEGFKMVVRARVTEVKDYYNIMVKISDGNIGAGPDTVNLSPIWGISSVSGYQVGDEVLVGLNYARGFVVGGGSGFDGALYTADTIIKAKSSVVTPTPTATVTTTSTANPISFTVSKNGQVIPGNYADISLSQSEKLIIKATAQRDVAGGIQVQQTKDSSNISAFNYRVLSTDSKNLEIEVTPIAITTPTLVNRLYYYYGTPSNTNTAVGQLVITVSQ